MERLSEDEIQQELTELDNWKRIDEKWIQRRYSFKDYLTGVQFVNNIANYAEDIQHHPFISIDYKKITVKLSSWRAKGLTDLDFQMAREFERFYQES